MSTAKCVVFVVAVLFSLGFVLSTNAVAHYPDDGTVGEARLIIAHSLETQFNIDPDTVSAPYRIDNWDAFQYMVNDCPDSSRSFDYFEPDENQALEQALASGAATAWYVLHHGLELVYIDFIDDPDAVNEFDTNSAILYFNQSPCQAASWGEVGFRGTGCTNCSRAQSGSCAACSVADYDPKPGDTYPLSNFSVYDTLPSWP